MFDSTLERLSSQIRRVAPLETTLLLGGETGTGKTRLAKIIHELSDRRNEPFLVVNCGALSETLIESEMFGHVRGSFTGADRDRTGKFAEAGRGTLLLDEVDSLPVTLQAKLLRVVEDRVFEPVGSNRTLPVRARLIAATNRELDREAAAGRFRADLYYRLNVVGFTLPPLRERRDVITDLACEFVAEAAARCGRPDLTLSESALWALQEYHWPGNIRELRNAIERSAALCHADQIEVEDLPERIWRSEFQPTAPRPPSPSPVSVTQTGPSTLRKTCSEAELTRILCALERQGNNRSRAAAELGISRMTLYKKLHKYGLITEAEAQTATEASGP